MNKKSKILSSFLIALSLSFGSYNLKGEAESNYVEKGAKEVVSQANVINVIPELNVIVSGQSVEFDVNAIVKNGRTLAPLRAVFESIGATVDWNSEEQKVYASRNGVSIELEVGSKVAKRNGETVNLSESATLYLDRTMVPLRFVGEAFGGIVNYVGVGKEKIVTISMASEVVLEVPDMKVNLNNKPLSYSQSPISKNNRNYLPLESIFDGLENKVYWTREGDKVSASIDGATLEMIVNKNYAVINGQRINTTHYPIDFKGSVMAPVRFVSEAFGGIVHFVEENKETHIYINRPKFKTNFLKKETIDIVKPINVSGAKLSGDRRLLVSDNPEILNSKTVPNDNVTLWHDTVKENKESQAYRVFGWHHNQVGEDVTIGITIENLSVTNTIKVKDLKGINRISSNGWSNYDIGLPIAETVLSDQLLRVNLNSSQVNSGETILLQKFDVTKDNIVGFLNDFTVVKASGTGELSYRIRTVLSKSQGNLSTIKSEPLPIDHENLHPRGVWPSSVILLNLPIYQAGSEEVSYSLSNGTTDNLMSVETSLDSENSVKNTGHYGATYKVRIPVVNNSSDTKTVRVRFAGRGGLYNGAVKTKDGVFITPILEPMKDVANVVDFEVSKGQDVIELEVMHAGGSALPMAVNIVTLD